MGAYSVGFVKSRDGVVVDKRLVGFIQSMIEWENDIYSMRFIDIDETFWFDSKASVQEFVTRQCSIRFNKGSTRVDTFRYVTDSGRECVYCIVDVKNGKITGYDIDYTLDRI